MKAFAIILLLFGIFFMFAAWKDLGKGQRPQKLIAGIIRYILGDRGTRIFGGILGITIFTLGIYILAMGRLPIGPPPISNDAVGITFMEQKGSNGSSTSGFFFTSLDELENKPISYGLKSYINYAEITLANNSLTIIPSSIWKMVNLRKLNLANNALTNLPINKLKTLKHLKTIILTGNPIDNKSIDSLKTALPNVEIEFKESTN